jgi:hypothetical protein
MASQYDMMMNDPQVLKNGQITTLATKLDYHGNGAGYLYVGPDWRLYLAPAKPAEFDERFMFQLEKPPQKSGGNPDLNVVYDGDDILIRSVANGRYVRYITNYGGTNTFDVNADEHKVKFDYRAEGQGTMEAFRVVHTDAGSERGRPVMMDGQHSYGFVNPRSVAWISASPYRDVRSSANAGPRESFFITDHKGEVPPSMAEVAGAGMALGHTPVALPAYSVGAPTGAGAATANGSSGTASNGSNGKKDKLMDLKEKNKTRDILIGVGIGLLLLFVVILLIEKSKKPKAE